MRKAAIPPMIIMGVSGSGKSTVGAMLADRLGVPFIDGDDLHPASNKEKMRAGIPLDDDDRHPWLAEIGSKLKEAQDRGGSMIVACSALKRRYRDRLRAGAPGLVFMHLAGDADVLAQRVAARGHEFMPGSLLASQLSALEPLGEDEQGVLLNVRESPSALVDRACGALARGPVPGRF